MKSKFLFAILLAVLIPTFAVAGSVTFFTPPGATTSGPVSDSAMFVTSTGQVVVTLTDLQANPTDVAQLLSDLQFNLSVGGTPSLSTSSGQAITVNGGGTFTTGATGATGWTLTDTAGLLDLCVICGGGTGPADLIIGPPGAGNLYSNANGS